MASPPLLLVLVCLLLTKSRSAWAGLIAGLLLLGWMARGRVRVERWRSPRACWACSWQLLVAAGFATRQLDREILTEAAKSLRYRAEYWAGTWGLITESAGTFLAGVGPGNFAGPYLGHKLAVSSEEIKDPHNLFLEAWATSGLFAVLALAAAPGPGPARTLGPPAPEPMEPDWSDPSRFRSEPETTDRAGWIWMSAGVGWFLLVPLGLVNPFAADLQSRWLILGATGAWAAAMLTPLWRRRVLPGWVAGAGRWR